MNPRLHPPETRLLDHIAGGNDPAARALMDCHLALCDACAAQVADLSRPGGYFLAAQSPLAVPPDLFARIQAGIAAAPPLPAALPFTQALAPYLPSDLTKGWRGALTPGFRFLDLAVELPRGLGLYLVHMAAGAGFPEHRHQGLEEAVILTGGLSDETGQLEAGDWGAMAAATQHAPKALADEDCWLVARMEGEILFAGWRGLLQRLA
jgi:putative transcriptional regulator